MSHFQASLHPLSQLAASLVFFSLAAVGGLALTRVDLSRKRRPVFLAIPLLFAVSGLAQMVLAFEDAGSSAPWATAIRVVLLLCLPIVAILVFFSMSEVLLMLKAGLEVARRRGQERFYSLVQAAPMAVVSTDCEGKITSWNPGAERMFGWTVGEMLATRAKTIPAERMTEQFALLDRALAGQINLGFESERVHRDGRRFPVSISNAPLHDENGKLIGIMATTEDISERKRMERELGEKSATLTAITNALNTFLESGDCAAASKHLLTRALQRTQSEYGFLAVVLEGPTLRVLAYEEATHCGQENHSLYESKLRQYAQDGFFEVAHHQDLLGEVIGKGQAVVANGLSTDSCPGATPAGRSKLRNFLGVPIFKGATVVGVLAVANRPGGYTGEEVRSLETMSQATGMLYDSYRQNLKRAELEEQQACLEREFRQAQKMEVLGQLSGGVAHDFNNMLMVLSGSTELLEHTLPRGSAAAPYVQQIRRTIDKAAAITRQLLAFSRKQVLDVKPTDLHEVLTDCEFMLPRLLGSDVQLTFQHLAAQSWMMADAAQLEQVLANLAINARDAMPNGGSLTISTRNAAALPEGANSNGNGLPAHGWLVLEVRDSGSGMDEETRSHLFEPFFTTKPLGKGTGLGLSTVYGIVRQFGGFIYVQSQPGSGSRFQIFFPVHQPAPQPGPNLVAPTGRPASPVQGLTILLADDEPALREAIAEYLRGAGHRVLESHSPADALELARSHQGAIDVLLTDVLMPGIRGTELARQVSEFHPDVHIIYMSGFAQSVPEAHIPAGAAFLQKPFRFAALAEQLKLVPRKN